MRWRKIGFAAATALCFTGAIAAHSEPSTAQPIPFQLPQKWGNLPAPTALVHLRTPLGLFTLPMGYLSAWYVLQNQPVATAPDGLRQFSFHWFSFQFEYPSGGMNSNSMGLTELNDPPQPWGATMRGPKMPGRTVVFVQQINPPDDRDKVIIARTLGAIPAGTLARNDAFTHLDQELWQGTAGSEAGHHIGVELSCIGNCLFSFYLERHHLMVEGYFNGKFRQQALAIAERVQDFYERWQTTPSINGQ